MAHLRRLRPRRPSNDGAAAAQRPSIAVLHLDCLGPDKKGERLHRRRSLHALHANALFDLGEPGVAIAPSLTGVAQAPPPTKGDILFVVAAASFAAGDREEGRRLMNEALPLNPRLSVASARLWDIPYIDRTIPERRSAVIREMGVPETPPGG